MSHSDFWPVPVNVPLDAPPATDLNPDRLAVLPGVTAKIVPRNATLQFDHYGPKLVQLQLTNGTPQAVSLVNTLPFRELIPTVEPWPAGSARVVHLTATGVEVKRQSQLSEGKTVELQPGDTYRSTFDIGNLFDLSRDGLYLIKASIAFTSTADGRKYRVEAEPVQVDVLPQPKTFNDMWNDAAPAAERPDDEPAGKP